MQLNREDVPQLYHFITVELDELLERVSNHFEIADKVLKGRGDSPPLYESDGAE